MDCPYVEATTRVSLPRKYRLAKLRDCAGRSPFFIVCGARCKRAWGIATKMLVQRHSHFHPPWCVPQLVCMIPR